MTSSEARTLTLERKLEQALAQIAALMGRLAADEQLLAQLASQQGGYGGAPAGLIPAVLTASLSAGTFGSPTSTTGTILVISGGGYTTSGGTAVTIYNPYATAITVSGSKFCWVTQRPSGEYFLVVADC
jgi:hypothetical protein